MDTENSGQRCSCCFGCDGYRWRHRLTVYGASRVPCCVQCFKAYVFSIGRSFHSHHLQAAPRRNAEIYPRQGSAHGLHGLFPPCFGHCVSLSLSHTCDKRETADFSLFSATAVIVPRRAGLYAPGIPEATLQSLVATTGKSLAYKDQLVFPAMIVTWCTFGATLVSFILAALAARHIKKYGPEDTLVGHKVSDRYANGDRMVEKQHNGHNESHA